MNAFEGIISDLDTTNFDFIKKGLEPLLELDVVSKTGSLQMYWFIVLKTRERTEYTF